MLIGRRLLNMSFVILLVSTLCFSVPGTRADTLPATAEDITPLATGDTAPEFSVQTVDGAPFEFDPSELRNPVVLISFRGRRRRARLRASAKCIALPPTWPLQDRSGCPIRRFQMA